MLFWDVRIYVCMYVYMTPSLNEKTLRGIVFIHLILLAWVMKLPGVRWQLLNCIHVRIEHLLIK